jgi:hypothetical protein
MDYSLQLLGKSLRDLTYNDIVHYFSTAREEHDGIGGGGWSAKASEGQTWEPLYKGVCAFLNSSGGLLIWGAPRGDGGKKEKFEGELTGIDLTFDKDTIVRKISSSISPLASDFRIRLLENENGKRVAVIEINESQYKPHQYNGVYYMRLDGHSRLAPHAYVEALFKRVALPNLEGYLEIGKAILSNDYAGRRYQFPINVHLFNFSSTQNEEGVYYRVTSSLAQWDSASWNEKSNPRAENGSGLRIIIHNDVIPVLVNGSPFKYTLRFKMTDQDLNTGGLAFSLMLQFGGKKSPPKASIYEVTFDRNDWGGDLFVIEKHENILIGESERISGMSREEQLKRALGE